MLHTPVQLMLSLIPIDDISSGVCKALPLRSLDRAWISHLLISEKPVGVLACRAVTPFMNALKS